MELVQHELSDSGRELLEREIVRAMARVPMFAGLTPRELRMLARESQTRVFAPGERIFEQGSEDEELHLVLQGQVNLCEPDGAGGERVVARVAERGCFGEIAFISAAPRSLAAVNGPVEGVQATISRLDFDRVAEHEPRIGFAVFRQLLEVVAARLIELPAEDRDRVLANHESRAGRPGRPAAA